MNNKVEALLYRIEILFRESLNQDDLLTNEHKRYDCLLIYNKHNFDFEYQCNPKYNKPTKEDLLGCLFVDSTCYESSKISDDDIENMQEFALNFGYDMNNLKELSKVYKGCKNTYNNLNKIFTKEDQELLKNYLEEKGLI